MTRKMAAEAAGDAWLFISRPPGMRLERRRRRNVFWLDARGDLRRAARQLFAALRRLDQGGFRRIHVERPAGAGLAEALADRLVRASARRGVGPPSR
jgi:L-threonylcarbamoyladenylate synthase